MQKIRVGLIGYGYSSKTFHAPLLANTEGVELALIASSNSQKVYADYPDISVVASAEQLINSANIDLVVIATPNDTHYSLAKKALLAGKHVVVDKPFTITMEEALDLEQLASRLNLLVSVFQNRRWDSDFLTVKALLNKQLIGDVVYFESHFDRFRPVVRDRWRENAGTGSGLWYDLGPHLLDQAVQLFGVPLSIYADLAILRPNGQSVDYFHTLLTYPDKRVVLHASMLVAEPTPRYLVYGTQGSYYKYGVDSQEEQLKEKISPLSDGFGNDKNDGVLTQYIDDKLVTNNLSTLKGEYLSYYNQIRDAINGIGPNPVTAKEAINIMQLIELGLQSHLEKKAIML